MSKGTSQYQLGPDQLDQITDAELAFATEKFLPPMEAIPKEFVDGNTKWNQLFTAWFFNGLQSLKVVPKAGIDSGKAIRCISAHMKSWGPKHEHKTAGVAYMMSMLFEDAEWE